MADIDVTSKLVKGPAANNEVGRGWTHKLEIDFADFVANPSAADNDTLTFDCFTIPAYSIVESVGFRLVTAFDDSGAGSSLTVALGDEDDPDGFMLATQVHVDGTEVFINADTGAYFIGTDSGAATTSRVIKGKTYTAAKTVEAIFTPSSYKLDECTTGKIVIFARILDTNILVAN
jgi:hypothetical protein